MSRRKANHAPKGVEVRHRKGCPNAKQKIVNCDHCKPSFRAAIYDPTVKGNYRRSPSSKLLAEVRAWQTEVAYGIHKGTLGASAATTVREAWNVWLAGAREGSVRNRSGDPFKPSVLRSYETVMRLHVLPLIGARKLDSLKRRDVQEVVDKLGLTQSASTVRNAINPLRTLCRWSLARDKIALNPCVGVELPAVRGTRDRFATAEEAHALITALPEADRALWATAFYSGLRRGELQALRWRDVNLLKGELRVEFGWDSHDGLVAPKSKAGNRPVPIPNVLRDYLVPHRIACALDDDEAFVFARSNGQPFSPGAIQQRADRYWSAANLERIGMHSARHTYASLMIDAMAKSGILNIKARSEAMGHAAVAITHDRYGHLMPGTLGELADALDTYVEAARTG